jgi:hypothetical protein
MSCHQGKPALRGTNPWGPTLELFILPANLHLSGPGVTDTKEVLPPLPCSFSVSDRVNGSPLSEAKFVSGKTTLMLFQAVQGFSCKDLTLF